MLAARPRDLARCFFFEEDADSVSIDKAEDEDSGFASFFEEEVAVAALRLLETPRRPRDLLRPVLREGRWVVSRPREEEEAATFCCLDDDDDADS